MKKTSPDVSSTSVDQIIARARNLREERERGYRAQALKLFPWVCGRCGREFSKSQLHELTVHHRDHDHNNNPSDGSNWELLCLYCHDDEHTRGGPRANMNKHCEETYKPFENLSRLLDNQTAKPDKNAQKDST